MLVALAGILIGYVLATEATKRIFYEKVTSTG
jgi:hypothetical protein